MHDLYIVKGKSIWQRKLQLHKPASPLTNASHGHFTTSYWNLYLPTLTSQNANCDKDMSEIKVVIWPKIEKMKLDCAVKQQCSPADVGPHQYKCTPLGRQLSLLPSDWEHAAWLVTSQIDWGKRGSYFGSESDTQQTSANWKYKDSKVDKSHWAAKCFRGSIFTWNLNIAFFPSSSVPFSSHFEMGIMNNWTLKRIQSSERD